MSVNYKPTLAKIETKTASSSASIEFTSDINSGFNVYYLSIRKLVASTNATELRMYFSTDNGSTYLSSGYRYTYQTVGSASLDSAAGSTSGSYSLIQFNQQHDS